jgi:hypothetical protein
VSTNVRISWVLAECLVVLGGSVPVAAGGSALSESDPW